MFLEDVTEAISYLEGERVPKSKWIMPEGIGK